MISLDYAITYLRVLRSCPVVSVPDDKGDTLVPDDAKRTCQVIIDEVRWPLEILTCWQPAENIIPPISAKLREHLRTLKKYRGGNVEEMVWASKTTDDMLKLLTDIV